MSLATAILTGDVAELPSRRDEDWRWTDLRGLIRALPDASPVYEGALAAGPFEAAETVLVINGHGPDRLRTRDDGVVAVRFVSHATETAHHARLAVEVGPGRSLTLLESYEGQGSGYLASAELDIRLGEGARLERIVLAADHEDAVSVSRAQVALSAGSVFEQTVLATGAKRQRIETQVVHPGHGASVRMDGAYLIAGKRHGDITTIVEHDGVDGVTSQLIKGVVRDQGRGVFQGRIVVAEGADRTDARMGHHALILSERAGVDAKPELLIFADDVQCAHGNTIGALDEDAIFYARQRGVPEDQARAMLTEAFIGEVIDRIGHEGAREAARAWARERLR
ncbi:MAG TPA: Fe-S cluster assembly protein SufD [Caulobacteraceae bacterium]